MYVLSHSSVRCGEVCIQLRCYMPLKVEKVIKLGEENFVIAKMFVELSKFKIRQFSGYWMSNDEVKLLIC